jgi:2-polyprenyl-6-methoxyphenol hydroxylase-like FAD-dependent oxidoreductase
MTNLSPEIVIVGGGVCGGALATVLARNGVEVVVLERETSYPDRVRGEFVAPWGGAEFKRLGLLDLLYARGAIHTKRNVPYDENWSAEHAEHRALDLTTFHRRGRYASGIQRCAIFWRKPHYLLGQFS